MASVAQDSSGRRVPRVVLYLHRLQVVAPTGVHRFATEISMALAAEDCDQFDIELCSGRIRGEPLATLGNVRLTHPRAPRRALHLMWALTGRPRVERVVGPIDIFHPLLPLAPIRSVAPQVISLHDLLPVHHPEWYPGLSGHSTRAAIHHHARVAQEVIVPSRAVADDVQTTLGVDPQRISVVHYGVNGVFAEPVSPPQRAAVAKRYELTSRPYLIAVGSITPRKNLEVLFEALAELRRRGGEVPALVLAGGDDHAAGAVHEAPARHGVADLVTFTDFVPAGDLVALMAGATALVHPSVYEGFGFTPLEAMAAGVPVISSDAGALPEVVGDAGLLAAPTDPAAWADSIQLVMTDAALRERLVAAGRDRAAGMTWSGAAQKTIAVYRRLMAADRSSSA